MSGREPLPTRPHRTAERRTGFHGGSWILAVWLGVVGVVGSADAQYISPGPTADGRLSVSGIPAESELDRRIEDARWRLGPLHVDPWLGVKDVSVVSDQTDGGDDTDLTATVGAGLRAYAGNEVVWAAHVLPEYVWWQDADDKGGLAGRIGTGVFGYLNRVRFELSWRQVEAQQYFNAELPLLTLLETRTTRAAIEVEVVRGGFIFAYGERDDFAGDADDSLTFTTLDRSQETLVAGLGLRGRDGFEVGIAIEENNVDFEETARSLSSEGDAVRLFLRLYRERLRAWLDIGRQEMEPTTGSRLRPFEETVGDLAVDWRASRSVELRAIGRRDVEYAVAADVSHIVSERVGFGVRLRPGRSVIGLLAATGDDLYEPFVGDRRIDDVEELQATFQMPIGDILRLGLRWSRIDYDSNQPAFDRDVTAYGLSLELGPLLDRWNVGSANGAW